MRLGSNHFRTSKWQNKNVKKQPYCKKQKNFTWF